MDTIAYTVRTKMIGLGLVAMMLAAALALATMGDARGQGGQDATPAAPVPFTTTASADDALAQLTGSDGTLRFDVAEDMGRFVFGSAPVFEDGMPAHGNAFITQGYIYPAGTLSGTNGVLADGSPEFPELVLGEWTCRGFFVGQGAHAATGPAVITTQVFNFGAVYGDAMLVTEGFESMEVGIPMERAISAGSGPFATARGDGQQTFLGFNATEGVNITLALAPVVG